MEDTATIKPEYLDFIGKKIGKVLYDGESGYYSQYARVFDVDSEEWRIRNVAERQVFLLQTQYHFNFKLRLDRHVFLNDVYEALGLIRVEEYEGRVGWIYDPEHPIGDNFIDFGLYNWQYVGKDAWLGDKDAFLLDFNVDGDILMYL